MASLTGTFSAIGNLSYDLAVAPGETANIVLTRTGSSDFSVAVDKRFNGNTYALVTTYTADQTAARINNDALSFAERPISYEFIATRAHEKWRIRDRH